MLLNAHVPLESIRVSTLRQLHSQPLRTTSENVDPSFLAVDVLTVRELFSPAPSEFHGIPGVFVGQVSLISSYSFGH